MDVAKRPMKEAWSDSTVGLDHGRHPRRIAHAGWKLAQPIERGVVPRQLAKLVRMLRHEVRLEVVCIPRDRVLHQRGKLGGLITVEGNFGYSCLLPRLWPVERRQ